MKLLNPLVWLFVSLSALHSCKKIELQSTGEVHRIKKGKHNSSPNFKGLRAKKVNWEGSFDASCIYTLTSNQGQINKLVGLSDKINPHKNSVRVGWRGDLNGASISIFAYVYKDGVRTQDLIDVISPEDNFKVVVCRDNIWYEAPGGRWAQNFPTGLSKRDNKMYLLSPYFGGEMKAPHDMYIYTDKMKFF